MRFAWLHISDLHAGMSDEEDLLPSVRKDLFTDLEYLLSKTGQIDLVLFTGDLAYRGSQGDYAQAENFLSRMWAELKRISGNEPMLAVVPGNHDLERPNDPEKSAALKALAENSEAQREFWHDNDNSLRNDVENMFRGYTEWWRTTALPKVPLFKAGILPGDFSATLEKEGHRIGVVGLNTAFAHVADDQMGRLAVNIRQLACAIPDDYEDWFAAHEFSLLLTHHPEEWFSDTCRQNFREIRPPGRFAAHLFGHLHAGSMTTFRFGAGGALNLFQAPSLFGLEHFGTGEERSHGYCVGQIDFEEKALVFWPRKGAQTQGGDWDFERDGGVGLPKDADHTEAISLGSSTTTARSEPAKLRIENISDPVRQRDDLRCAIQINNEKLPETERYNEPDFVKLIQHHLSGDFGPHRPSAYWKGHLLVAKYAAEVVGMLLGYDDFKANFCFISYLAAKSPRPDVSNEDPVSEKLLEEFFRIHKEAKAVPSPRFLTEVDDPARADDPAERLRRLARIALFDKLTAYQGIELRVLDLAYLQPKLDPWSDNVREQELVLLYAAEQVPASLPKTEALDILTWTYTQLYAANMFDNPADFERYMGYISNLLKRIANRLLDSVELLRVQKLRGRLREAGLLAPVDVTPNAASIAPPAAAEVALTQDSETKAVPTKQQFDVFLSHNSRDKPTVRQLADELESRRLKVWLDERELVPGRPWEEALEEIIQTTKSAAVLVGADGIGPWEAPEMRGCLSEFVKRRMPVIPVLLPGAPKQPDLPLFLTQLTWVDLRGGLTKDGLDRLQWGVTGQKPRPRTHARKTTRPRPSGRLANGRR